MNPSDAPIMDLAMSSDAQPFSEVFTLADQLIWQRISQVEGVSQVALAEGRNPPCAFKSTQSRSPRWD